MNIRPTTSSTAVLQGPVVDTRTGTLTPTALKWFLAVQTAVNNGLTSQGTFIGVLDANVTVGNRTEGIGTDLQNIDSDGVLLPNGIDFARAYLNKSTDHINDGMGNPLAGGKEAYSVLVASSPAAHQSLVYSGTAWEPAQVDYADLTGKPVLPATEGPTANKWLNSYDAVTGAFTESQPAFTDVSGQITTAQLPASGLSVTITTAKLTGGGTNGSMTFTNGILTAQTPAT
jgi:hypothetical protein